MKTIVIIATIAIAAFIGVKWFFAARKNSKVKSTPEHGGGGATGTDIRGTKQM